MQIPKGIIWKTKQKLTEHTFKNL